MTQYERILIMDSDEVLQTNIDAVFEDPKAVILKPKPQPEGFKQLEHEAPFPEEYLMAGMEELANTHKFPTQGPEDYYQGGGYLNAGFMLVKPSQDVFEYYVSLTKVNSKKADGTWLFNPVFPEQALLNYAHRMDGPMPWIPLDPLWMLHLATAEDVKKTKPKGIHTKWWTQPEMKIWLETWKWRMDAFWQGREEESDDR
jgi:alpha-N-acetylglucosamine transferase